MVDFSAVLNGITQRIGQFAGSFQLPDFAQQAPAFRSDPLGGLQSGSTLTRDPLAGMGGGATFARDPLSGVSTTPFSAPVSFGNAGGGYQYDPLRALQQRYGNPPPPPTTPSTSNTSNTTLGGATANPAMGGDLTGAQVDQFIHSTRPNSPLNGQGAFIVQTAKENGVPVPVILGIMMQESELGTTGPLPGVHNYTGLTGTNWQGQTGTTSGMARAFAQFATTQDGIRAAIQNYAQGYRGLTIKQAVSKWLTGDPNGSGDEQGNSVNDYLNTMAAVFSNLGVGFDPNAVPTQESATPPSGGTKVTPHGYAFPVAGYTGKAELHWGTQSGASDLMAPAGTPVVAMRGGTVIFAGYDSLGGNAVEIQGDDGLLYYYAHFQNTPPVSQGQRVVAGTNIGAVGNTGNAAGGPAHLHLGIGPTIVTGGGPTGGEGAYANGAPYDAVGLLNNVLGGW